MEALFDTINQYRKYRWLIKGLGRDMLTQEQALTLCRANAPKFVQEMENTQEFLRQVVPLCQELKEGKITEDVFRQNVTALNRVYNHTKDVEELIQGLIKRCS